MKTTADIINAIEGKAKHARYKAAVLDDYAAAVAPFEGKQLNRLADATVEKLKSIIGKHEALWQNSIDRSRSLPRCLAGSGFRSSPQTVDAAAIRDHARQCREEAERLAALIDSPAVRRLIDARIAYDAAAEAAGCTGPEAAAVSLAFSGAL